MEALEFLKAAKRRYISNPDEHFSAIYFDLPDFELYIKELEKWAKENPIKTRQTEFIKMFPDVEISRYGTPAIAPCTLNKRVHDDCTKNDIKCSECYKKFWSKEAK